MIEEAQQWAVPAAAWLLTYLIHSTLLIAGVWLIGRRLDGRPAALDALWKTALVGGLITATLQNAAGVSPWGGRLDLMASAMDGARAGARPEIGPSQTSPLHGSPHALVGPATDDVAARGEEARPAAAQRAPEARSQAGAPATDDASSRSRTCSIADSGPAGSAGLAGPVVASRTGSGATSGPGTGSGPGWSPDPGLWLTAAFLAWAVVAALLWYGLVRSWLRLRRLLADRRPIESGPPSTMLARLSAGVGRGRLVRLSASPRVDVPIAVGVLRPEIVVPERALRELQPAELESLLAHELAHLMRRDPVWRLIAGCIQRVLFLQPLNRVAAANLENASEILCDDWAVERTDRPLALARCLTEVAAWVATPLGASVPAMARHGSGLGRRVRRLVAAGDGQWRRRRDRWPVPVAGGALALVVFAAPGASEMAGPRPAAPLPYAPAKLVSTDPGSERMPAAASAGETPKPRPARPEDARRLLEQLRAGKQGDHDLSDWVALAQLLGSSSLTDLAGLLDSGSDRDQPPSAGGTSYVSPDDIEELIEGALTKALASGGLDAEFDFDIDFDAQGGIDIHINGLDILNPRSHEGDDSDPLDLDLDLDGPDVDVDVDIDIPDPPEPPEPPEPAVPPEPPALPDPPDSDCDGDNHDHGREGRAAGRFRRDAVEAARLTREQIRRALEQAHRAGEHARIQAREHARALSRAAGEEARRIRGQLAEHLRNAEREVERQGQRLHEEMQRQLREQERARERQREYERERELERQR